MSNDKDTRDEKISGDLRINLSAGENKIKYYECNADNCIFEIIEDKEEENPPLKNSEKKYIKQETKEEVFNNGRIVVKSILDCDTQEVLKGVKINLYKINGLSPILMKSKITNENGEAVFSNIQEGSYRIIELVNKEYFEKPKYIDWNEITIDRDNKREKILIVNKLRVFKS
ncbi:MAG: collagen binding domain-containing protein [Clostridium sp.]